MKRFTVVSIVVLVGVNAWLAFKQYELQRTVATLQRDTQNRGHELGPKAEEWAHSFAHAQAQLEQARMTFAAAEQRLANAATAVQNIPGVMQQLPGAAVQPAIMDVRSAANQSSTDPLRATTARSPASSHSPDGQLFQRSWGPEQMLGPPNTDRAGDLPTAWAPRESHGSDEWLNVNYDQAVDVAEIRVRETLNPGAISKIAALLPNGQELTVWEGTEPPAQAPVDMSFPVVSSVQANSIRIYLDRRRAPGWNEIDAVELIGRDGSRQWASSASASSTYAEQ